MTTAVGSLKPHPDRNQPLSGDNTHLGMSARQRLSAGQPRPYTAGVWPWSFSMSQTTRSSKEDLDDYGDPHVPEVDCLEEEDHNWAMELQAHITFFTYQMGIVLTRVPL